MIHANVVLTRTMPLHKAKDKLFVPMNSHHSALKLWHIADTLPEAAQFHALPIFGWDAEAAVALPKDR